MKTQMTKFIKPALTIAIASAMIVGWCAPARAHDDDHDRFFGSKALLTVFHDAYWRWVPVFGNGNVTLPKDSNGNAVLAGVALMPYPDLPDGTNGTVNVTLKADQPFFTPLIGIFGTSYTDPSKAPDPFVDAFEERKLKLKLKLDGKTILDDDDATDYLVKFAFDPTIPYNQFGVDSILWFEGIGVLQKPLSPGRHVFKLDEKLPVPVFGFTSDYHITFNVTVQPKGH